jgi:stress response protein YsnF
VSIERRFVDQPVSSDDRGALFQDREVEMRATSEEAVIGKEARMTEEVVVQTTAGERTENVQDTVCHTGVEVDETDRSTNR